MSAYPFLVLALLFLLPGAVIFALRRDLRPVMAVVGACSVPFAFTEWLFYPTYWSPRFMFDLVEVLGFGIEDVLFVVGLGAFTSTAYAFAWRRGYAPLEPAPPRRRQLARGGAVLGVLFLGVAALALLEVPMIYGAPALMVLGSAGMLAWRRDLLGPALGGAAVTTVVYTVLCLALGALIPDVFALEWHTERFLHRFVLGVPVEELLYAATSGLAATIFYPFAAGRRFVAR